MLLWAVAAAWLGLAVARGRFWDARADSLRDPEPNAAVPDVHAVIPARDEADVVERTLESVIAQDYGGRLRVTFVDDRSSDGTGAAAARVVACHAAAARVSIVEARPRPDGWSGKVWALREGVAAARSRGERPAYWWFTDADVEHDAGTLARLVATAGTERRALVSEMVALHCASPTERLLIPAFVYFFRLLYPFAWVNDDRRSTAAAAGGSVLFADAALTRIGGLERIAGALIDDCSLAAAVKRDGGGLWLGLATRSRSLRPYPNLGAIWNMVARTAYTQLAYSPLLLAGTVAGIAALYCAPPLATVGGALAGRRKIAIPAALAWSVMTATYVPTVRRYGLRRRTALTLPLAAALYAAMTIDSALRHHRGHGGTWKGRPFARHENDRTLIVRSATTADIPPLTEILNAIIRVGGTTAFETAFSHADFGEKFVYGAHVICCHVAVERDTQEALGFQILERYSEPPDNRIDIATFARLNPKVAGVGTALFAATRETAKALNIATIVAEIRADNRSGLAYYDRMGFKTFKTLPSVPLRDGTPVDRILKRFDPT